MCVTFKPSRPKNFQRAFQTEAPVEADWKEQVHPDELAPIIMLDSSERRIALLASYGMIPKARQDNKRFTTVNARAETLGQRMSYSAAWKNAQLCLVPLTAFIEPSYETGQCEMWEIGRSDTEDFAVAGLWRAWREAGGNYSYSFTQITINADDHAVMQRFHPAGEEKRSLVILHEDDYDDWLSCRNPERARTYLQAFPAERMQTRPAPRKRQKEEDTTQGSLF